MAFGKVFGLGQYRKDVPAAARHAAGIIAVMAEDCGPCTQLAIDMAEREGVDPAILRAVVARDFAAMPPEVALAVRFAQKTMAHAPEADELREEVVRMWGKRAVITLAFAIMAARLFPTLKYAMGHGHACTRLTIGGETQPVRRELTRAA
jgi:alkylhydroperoxidase family enzyme